ncbi:MAG TPA: DUF47 family protein [Kofleriaceae bacterium]|nr:DUF47 family protein [Kofleriaceae bacterium]
MIKQAIVEVLGERDLLVPELVHAALEANARAKYFFTVLQLARAHADALDAPVPDLRVEREVAGIEDVRLDTVVEASRNLGDRYRIPLVDTILEQLLSDIRSMISPLRLAAGPGDATVAAFDQRLAAIRASCPARSRTTITAEAIEALTSSDSDRGDSAHWLVFELHKAIDALQTSLATDNVNGAKTYKLGPDDRTLIAAFMEGVHRTEAARLGHPGLGTTATRSGSKLIVENDIGETSAHVVVMHVEGLHVDVTATDVHLRRLEFLQQLLSGFSVQWTDLRSRRARELEDAGVFYETVGTFMADDLGELERFLAHVGSRLVFLIDWNRARKALCAFVPKGVAVALLGEAADDGHGHRGFLEMGGEQLVFDAMATVIRTPLRYGEDLDDVLGIDDARSFLRATLRTCSIGLQEGRSRALIQARVRAELSSLVRTHGERLLEPVAEHAALVLDIGRGLRDQLRALSEGPGLDQAAAARAAKERERRADDLVVFVRGVVARRPDAEAYRRVIELADDAADAFEEAAFLVSLLPDVPRPLSDNLRIAELGDLAVNTAEAYAATVESARAVGQAAVQATLEAVDTITALERQMDDGERRAVSSLARHAQIDTKTFVLASRFVAECERAVDALTHAALALRDRITTA